MQIVTFLVSFGFVASLWLSAHSKPIEENPKKPLGPFHDFLKLFPLKKIEGIVQFHLENDPGFRAAVKLLKSDSWIGLMEKVTASPEFKKFSEVTGKFNFNITQASSCIIDHIKSLKTVDDEVPSVDGVDMPQPDLESFLKDIQQVLPFGKFAKLLSDENLEFKKIREEVATEENRQIALALHNAPDMVELRKNLKSINFDIQPYISLLYSVLGWQPPE